MSELLKAAEDLLRSSGPWCDCPELVVLRKAVEAAKAAGPSDTERLDWLESLPCAFTIHRDQPKADSLPPLRARIDQAMDDLAAMAAEKGASE